MATTTILLAGPGAVWLKAIDLWYGVVTGTYTAWTYAWTPDGDFRVFTITVTNPDTSTDDFVLVDILEGNGNDQTLTSFVASPGFRNPLPYALPETMPDSSDTWRAFRDGPIAFRQAMFGNYCDASMDTYGHDATGTRYGVYVTFFPFTYYRGLTVVSDCMTVMTGTMTADQASGPPSDGVGASTITAPAGAGGGSTDITPLIGPLQDIALRDVSYSFNNGATIFNCNGKVNV